MGLPFHAGPLWFRLAGGKVVRNLDLIKSGPACHGVLIG
jgi:hypothetical protein